MGMGMLSVVAAAVGVRVALPAGMQKTRLRFCPVSVGARLRCRGVELLLRGVSKASSNGEAGVPWTSQAPPVRPRTAAGRVTVPRLGFGVQLESLSSFTNAARSTSIVSGSNVVGEFSWSGVEGGAFQAEFAPSVACLRTRGLKRPCDRASSIRRLCWDGAVGALLSEEDLGRKDMVCGSSVLPGLLLLSLHVLELVGVITSVMCLIGVFCASWESRISANVALVCFSMSFFRSVQCSSV